MALSPLTQIPHSQTPGPSDADAPPLQLEGNIDRQVCLINLH